MFRHTLLVLLMLIMATGAVAGWSHDPADNDLFCDAEGYQTTPKTIADGQGGAFIIWNDARPNASEGYDLYMQRVDADGVRQLERDGQLVLRNNQNVADGRILFQVISLGEDGFYIVASGDSFADISRVYAQRVTLDGSLPWGEDGVPVRNDTAGALQRNAKATIGSNSSLVVSFDRLADAAATEKDIYIQCVSVAGARIWGSGGQPVSTDPGDQALLLLLEDAERGAVVLYSDDQDEGPYSTILAMGFDDNGQPRWAAPTEVSSSSESFGVRAVRFNDYSWVLALYGGLYGDTASDLYLTRLWESGSLTSRVPIETDIPRFRLHEMAVTSEGGIWLVWQDDGAGDHLDHCQFVDENGSVRFPAGGVTLFSGHASTYAYPSLLLGGDGSAHIYQVGVGLFHSVVWGQKVSPEGDLLWGEAGLTVGAPLANKANMKVAPLSTGHLVVWEEIRQEDNFTDIYGQLVHPAGHLGNPAPRGLEVSDAPNDQGGIMELSWWPSYLDAESEAGLERYTIWRRNGNVAKASSAGEMTEVAGLPEDAVLEMLAGGWIYSGEAEPMELDHYGFLAPSFGDSTETVLPLSEYMVMAHDRDGNWFEGRVVGGWTVDNLSPAAPGALSAATEGLLATLRWDGPQGYREDLSHYNIFRSAAADFQPGAGTFVGSAGDTLFADNLPSGGPWYYRVTAVDLHGNESEPSNLAQVLTTSYAGAAPAVFAVRGAYPNPFNPGTHLRFEVPARTRVQVAVFDLRGRQVRSLLDGMLEAGEQDIAWNGRGDDGRVLPSGTYFARVRCGAEEGTIKLLLTK